MVLCANSHENLDGLSHCRVCGLPLLDLKAEFTSLAESLASRTEMGRPSPSVLIVGLGTVGVNLVNTYKMTCIDPNLDCLYLEIDSDDIVPPNGSNGILPLKLNALTGSSGTFCGIGESVMRSDPNLVPILRKAGLSHKDDNQIIFFITSVGGGIGSTTSVLIEKCRQLNPNCHTVVMAIIPGADEFFHNHLNAYYGLARLLTKSSPHTADLVIAVRYDRIKNLRGVGTSGQELTNDDLLVAFSDLIIKNISPQYIAEIVRINQSVGVSLVVPCLALGRSVEIFGNLANILESAIAYPANNVLRQSIRTCHLLLRAPKSQASSFREEVVNEQLWAFIRRNLPGVKGASSSITYINEQHDRIEACLLLGGGSAMSALFASDVSAGKFREEIGRQNNWQTYGLSEEAMTLAGDVITTYDSSMEKVSVGQVVRSEKTKNVVSESSSRTRRRN